MLRPFVPLFRNPHLQTLAGHFWPRPAADARFPLSSRLHRTEPDVQVLVQSQHPPGPPAGEIVIVHGLEGSGESGYMRGLSGVALAAGFAVHRFHMRTCGGTERLCPTLYHAGLTGDLSAVLQDFHGEGRAPAFLVGFSLGGNVVLKLAAELGASATRLIQGVCSLSTPLDLGACARRIHEPSNRIYERRFVLRMRQRLCATGRYHRRDLAGLRSVFEIDDRITAPSFGFGDAANYYRTQSALGYLDRLRVPVLLLQAKDDPLVPFHAFTTEAVRGNAWIELAATEHGGHLGFIGRRPHRFWADETIMDWIAAKAAKNLPGVSSKA